ncbi:MAG: hypothetical protein JWN23_3430 [Rhodocyclales bacterium]|nr:hypothetical protein [Rhodocyclales bacterium]
MMTLPLWQAYASRIHWQRCPSNEAGSVPDPAFLSTQSAVSSKRMRERLMTDGHHRSDVVWEAGIPAKRTISEMKTVPGGFCLAIVYLFLVYARDAQPSTALASDTPG